VTYHQCCDEIEIEGQVRRGGGLGSRLVLTLPGGATVFEWFILLVILPIVLVCVALGVSTRRGVNRYRREVEGLGG
jgi:hypothetical protein